MKNLNLSYSLRISKLHYLLLALVGSFFLSFLGVVGMASAQTITANVGPGSTGTNVSNLQRYLSTTNFYPQALVTGYFGSLTTQAVQRFQVFYGIVSSGSPSTTGYGNVGPLTRSRINALISGTGGVTGGQAPMIFASALATSSATSTVATLSWSTNVNTQGRVYYATSPLVFLEPQTATGQLVVSNGQSAQSNSGSNFTTSHTISLPGLATSTTYYYMIEARDNTGNFSVTWPSTFRTNTQ